MVVGDAGVSNPARTNRKGGVAIRSLTEM